MRLEYLILKTCIYHQESQMGAHRPFWPMRLE